MRFLIDANLPRSTAALLRNLGHQVEFARDIGLAAAPDQDIAAHAKRTDAVLLTRDLDFSNIRQYPPETHSGLVVLRLADDAAARTIALPEVRRGDRGRRRSAPLSSGATAGGRREIAVFIEDTIRCGRLDRAQGETSGSRRMTRRV